MSRRRDRLSLPVPLERLPAKLQDSIREARQGPTAEARELGKAQRQLRRQHDKPQAPVDWARHQHDELSPGRVADAHGEVLRVVTQRQIDRYRTRGELSVLEFEAAERLLALWVASGAASVSVSSFAVRVSGVDRYGATDRQLAAMVEFKRALAGLPPELADVAVRVVVQDDSPGSLMAQWRQPRQAGMVLLRVALRSLDRHFRGKRLTPE